MNTIVALGFVLAAATTAPTAQDLLSTAKNQYAAAAYEDALATLTRVEQTPPDVARQVEQYRLFCLFALGRTAEAETSAEALLRTQPLDQLDDASPRIEAMFLAVRKRLLPSLIRAEYRTARSALDEKNFPKSEPHLIQARKMLAAAQEAGAWDEALADLGVLVDGFIELGRGAARPAPAEAPRQPAAPVATSREADSRPHAEAPVAPAIYSTGDDGVVPPVAIDQKVPSLPSALRSLMRVARPTGILAVLVDETGAVQASEIRQPTHPSYDALLLNASRGWKYRPATKDGSPVKFRKLILVSVTVE
jgi:tetratricopeptide (TPR) repeat protein